VLKKIKQEGCKKKIIFAISANYQGENTQGSLKNIVFFAKQVKGSEKWN